MKFLRLGSALSAAVLAVPTLHASASVPGSDYVCFMTTEAGQVVNLSESLCKSNKPTTENPAKNDRAFIEDYKRNLREYPMEYPDVRNNLLASAEQSPELTISQAKSVCSDLQAGLSWDEIQQSQDEEMVERAEMVNAAIINSLAPKYYCPEMSNG